MLSAHSRAHVDCVSRVVKNASQLPQLPVPDLILDSWRRSMEQHHLDPGSLQGPRILSEDVLKQCRERSELFLNIASEEVARLHGRVRDADYCVLLTDAQGQTIDYRVETAIRNDCRKAGLYLGTCWSEGEEGTCGVAAVLTAKTPVTVHKRDHFRAAFIGLTCSAASLRPPGGTARGAGRVGGSLTGRPPLAALDPPDGGAECPGNRTGIFHEQRPGLLGAAGPSQRRLRRQPARLPVRLGRRRLPASPEPRCTPVPAATVRPVATAHQPGLRPTMVAPCPGREPLPLQPSGHRVVPARPLERATASGAAACAGGDDPGRHRSTPGRQPAPGGAGQGSQSAGVDPGRNRLRQRGIRPPIAPGQPAPRAPVRRAELRRHF